MRPFLDRLARLLLEHHRDELDRIAVVLPGRRAGLHLRKYLAEASGSALWSPEILDIGSYMARTSGLVQGGSLELLFLLHEAHRSLSGAQAEGFAEFLEWAPVTMRDMSEVDAHLIDLDDLYRDLREYHELEEWSFRLGELSPGQVRLGNQWRSTGTLHRAFVELMDERGMATSGHIGRRCAKAIVEGTVDPPWKMIWFAGLNALDPASTTVIRHLQERGFAQVAWDTDEHYLSDVRQEAGRYLRRSIKELGPGAIPPIKAIQEGEREIRIVASPNALAQTTYAAQRLAALSPEERSRTAVVLAKEDLLFPLLEQLPADIGPLNVTMGMPLNALPVHGLTEAFFKLHSDAGPDGRIQMADLEALLGHPFLHEGATTAKMIASLRERQEMRIAYLDLQRIIKAIGSPHADLMERCLSPMSKVTDQLSERIIALFNWAKQCAPKDRSVQEQLFQMARLHQRMERALERSGLERPDLRTYIAIRDRLLGEERISFLGEPLRGTQIMGLLETRALDHERLIMISVNEGVLPTAARQQTWIPFDIRRHFKLPVPADGEAISAYHFHRALQLARDVELIHNADANGDGSEPSRFIAQWRREVGPGSSTRSINRAVAASPVVRNAAAIVVQKDAATMTKLGQLAERGFSPSALGTWLRCPLDFYFKYIVGIKEVNVADGTLGSDVLGDAVHHVLQELFKPLTGSVLTPDAVSSMIPRVPELMRARLAQQFARSTLDQGHFRLRMAMATSALEKYLSAEADRCAIEVTRILAVEEDVEATLSNGVKLRGRCDRIDERDGLTVLLDMKTGSVRAEHLRLNALSRDAIGPNQRYALQLLIYAWTYMMKHPELSSMSAGVIPLRRASNADGELLKLESSTLLDRTRTADMDALLSALVNELMDPSIPFTHDPGSEYCTCCVA